MPLEITNQELNWSIFGNYCSEVPSTTSKKHIAYPSKCPIKCIVARTIN